jgi:hypothetical protein
VLWDDWDWKGWNTLSEDVQCPDLPYLLVGVRCYNFFGKRSNSCLYYMLPTLLPSISTLRYSPRRHEVLYPQRHRNSVPHSTSNCQQWGCPGAHLWEDGYINGGVSTWSCISICMFHSRKEWRQPHSTQMSLSSMLSKGARHSMTALFIGALQLAKLNWGGKNEKCEPAGLCRQ